jgi:hypothetical protein
MLLEMRLFDARSAHLVRPARACGAKYKLSSTSQFQVVSPLSIDRACADSCANRGAYGSALATFRNSAYERADGCANRRSLQRSVGLIVALFYSSARLVIHANMFAAHRSDGFYVARKICRAAITQDYALKG